MRPIRIVLRWQVIATALLSVLFGILWGGHGALSAALGGGLNVVAGMAYGFMASRRDASSAGEALRTIFRAEALKVLLILLQLTAVLSSYGDIVHAAFFATFVVTVVVFSAAVAVRDTEENKTPGTAGDL
jgi:ATP synthase protein I